MRVRFGLFNSPSFPEPEYLVRGKKQYDFYSIGSHETRLFRDAVMFGLPKLLKDLYKERTDILCYAASGGHEPYSLSIALAEELGSFDEVSSRFDIRAFDINGSLVEFAKDGYVILSEIDSSCLPDFDRVNCKELFLEPEVVKNEHYGGMLYPVFGFGKYSSYKVADPLRKTISFDYADLVRDLQNGSEYFEKPAVFMFRNSWFNFHHLADAERACELLKERLKPGSLVVLGETETTYIWQVCNGKKIQVHELLEANGFRDLKQETYRITDFCKKEGFIFLRE